MKCHEVEKNLSAYLDGFLPQTESQTISLHLKHCPKCTVRCEQTNTLRSRLRGLPAQAPPVSLTCPLRVSGSKEQTRRRRSATFSEIWENWAANTRLWRDNLMRPLAIPLAGGLASAVFLFGMVVPNVATYQSFTGNDVPTALYTEATVKSTGPFTFGDDDIIVELTVDEQGRMVDYSFPSKVSEDPELLRIIENNLLFTTFTPATTFGQPTAGKVRVSFSKSHIEVKG